MLAFHSFWSKPNRANHYEQIQMDDFEILTMMLSALKWRSFNGSIRMVTDSAGAEFFARNGLERLWDGGVDVCLDDIPAEIDPVLFWAAGKMQALQSVQSPCVMLDTDLIIWKDIRDRLQTGVIAAHCEKLEPGVYPDPHGFPTYPEYSFPKEWDFRVEAANTAFLYMPSEELKAYYVEASFDFMRNVGQKGMNPITAMCFAEQRVLPMCTKACGVRLEYLLDAEALDQQDFVTHLWGYKRRLRGSEEERKEFCLRCVRRLMRDYPETGEILTGIDGLRGYYDLWRSETFG